MLNKAPAAFVDLQPERLFGPLGLLSRPTVVVAVSGGSDSLSLLTLLYQWFSRHNRVDALLAVTVDHRLRPEAAHEARAVAAFCADRGIHHRIKAWTAAKPASGLAAAAREARYRLLLEAAREANSDIILTGHTEDDQAETVAMRAARGDGPGLAGMAPETLLDGAVWLLRPLLQVSRARLRDFLRSQDLSWFDDPGNSNPATERARVRVVLTTERRALLLDQAGEASMMRRDLAERAAKRITSLVTVEGAALRIAPSFFQDTDQEAALHALRLLLGTLGGSAHWPDRSRSFALFQNLGQPGFSGSLGGCVAVHRRSGITIRRERRGKEPSSPAALPITMMFSDKPLRALVPGFDLPAYRALQALFAASPFPALPFSDPLLTFPLTDRT